MYTKSSYTKLTENRIDKNEKKSNWEVAIGLNEVDSLKPSKYLIELMQDSIEGKKSYKEVENALYSYYKELDPNDEAILQTEECDLVSVRIVQLLENGSFKFSPITLKTIASFSNPISKLAEFSPKRVLIFLPVSFLLPICIVFTEPALVLSSTLI